MSKRRPHIHSVIVSYNRLELTQQAISSYLDTVTLPHSLIVVDNNSTDGTVDWLLDNFPFGLWDRYEDGRQQCYVIPMAENKYPGYACNYGWEHAPERTTILHRADNDFAFLPGWCDHVLAVLENKAVGQVGLRTDAEEMWNSHNVGGNCVIRREVWDQGLRYDERPWPEIARKVPGYTEDSFLSPAVRKLGWEWARVKEPCIRPISREEPGDPYYEASWADRGIKR
jgi:glycosyltransferase involved in cell wall biosynthesis